MFLQNKTKIEINTYFCSYKMHIKNAYTKQQYGKAKKKIKTKTKTSGNDSAATENGHDIGGGSGGGGGERSVGSRLKKS